MTRPRRVLAAAAALAALAAPAASRAEMMRPVGPRRGGPPAFLQHFYPPRLVMRSQEAIELTVEQRRAITDQIAETRKELKELEERRAAAATTFGTLVSGPRVDEEAALARAAELMATEQDIKRVHLRLLVRVKNQLTPEQQAKLDGLRDEWLAERRRRPRGRPRPGGPGGPGGPGEAGRPGAPDAR